MRYMGSKRRLAKHIIEATAPYRRPGQTWVEPFVGGGNMIAAVSGPRIGADAFKPAVDALILIRDHLDALPTNNKEFTEADYKELRRSESFIKPYAGFAFSFGGKWFGGWSRDGGGGGRDYVAEAYRNAVKQSPLLQGVSLVRCDYQGLNIPPNSLVYCDPPYSGTTAYSGASSFDSERFWRWCQNTATRHDVFVSEYSCPVEAEVVFERPLKVNVKREGSYNAAIEKLFKVAPCG